MMIVNDNSRVVNKLEASLTDDVRVIIYNCHMFIVQATGVFSRTKFNLEDNMYYKHFTIIIYDRNGTGLYYKHFAIVD